MCAQTQVSNSLEFQDDLRVYSSWLWVEGLGFAELLFIGVQGLIFGFMGLGFRISVQGSAVDRVEPCRV